MTKPSREQAEQRRAVVAAKLEPIAPTWERGGVKLYRGNDGYFIMHGPNPKDYIGITPKGEMEDLAGYDVSSYDYERALQALRGVGEYELELRVRTRYAGRYK